MKDYTQMANEAKVRARGVGAEEYVVNQLADALLACQQERDSLCLPADHVDAVLERFDQTDPALQRQIVAGFAARLAKAEAERDKLAAEVKRLRADPTEMTTGVYCGSLVAALLRPVWLVWLSLATSKPIFGAHSQRPGEQDGV